MFRHPLERPGCLFRRSTVRIVSRGRVRPFFSSRGLREEGPSSKPPFQSRSRIDRIINRLPRFLQTYAVPLRHAPLTHISAFLLLHELTAIIPLFGLAALFHYTRWLPPYISQWKWVTDGMEKFGRYFRKKGWLKEDGRWGAWGWSKEEKRGRISTWYTEKKKKMSRWWTKGEGGARVLAEFATAYAITKALLPLRLVISVWSTPWFARIVVVPTTRFVKNLFV